MGGKVRIYAIALSLLLATSNLFAAQRSDVYVATDRFQSPSATAGDSSCLAVDSDQYFGDVDCDGVKDAGEAYLATTTAVTATSTISTNHVPVGADDLRGLKNTGVMIDGSDNLTTTGKITAGDGTLATKGIILNDTSYVINGTGASYFTDGLGNPTTATLLEGGVGAKFFTTISAAPQGVYAQLADISLQTGYQSYATTTGLDRLWSATLTDFSGSRSGYFTDNLDSPTKSVVLVDGTYALSVTGNSTLGYTTFSAGSPYNVDLANNVSAWAGLFQGVGGTAYLADGTYAINATGKSHFIDSSTWWADLGDGVNQYAGWFGYGSYATANTAEVFLASSSVVHGGVYSVAASKNSADAAGYFTENFASPTLITKLATSTNALDVTGNSNFAGGVVTVSSDLTVTGTMSIPSGTAPLCDAIGEMAFDSDVITQGLPTIYGTSLNYIVATNDTPNDNEVPQYDAGTGTILWEAPSVGDITSVGDVADGAAFDGTQGTTLTFNNAGGDQTLNYDGYDFGFSSRITTTALTVTGTTGLQGALTVTSDATVTGTMTIAQGTAPVVDAAGEIAIDTTGSQLIYYGAAKKVISPVHSKSVVVESPVATDDFPFWCTQEAITITAVHVTVYGGTNWVGQLAECDGNGLNCVVVDSADITANAGTEANDDGSLSNPSIDQGDYVGLITTSVSGTNTLGVYSFDYTVDAT